MNGVTVAICCYNSSARIAETLRHLSLQRLSENIPWEVLIIDNVCTDDTLEVAHRAWQGVQPAPLRIVPEKIPGLMQARHCAMRESRYELVSFIDDDNWVAADWVERVWQRLQTDPDMAACGGQNAAATEVAAPYWFDRMAYAYAVGKQAESSSYVTPQRGFLRLVDPSSAYFPVLPHGVWSTIFRASLLPIGKPKGTPRPSPTGGEPPSTRTLMPTHPKTDTPASDPHEPIARLQLRAALFAAPDTLVTAKEFARAMGVRRLSASQQPATARPIGGSVRAPFLVWLEVFGAASTPKRHRAAP